MKLLETKDAVSKRMDSELNTVGAENRTIHPQGDSIAERTDLQILYLLQFLDEFFWYIAVVEAPFITLESFKIRESVITGKKLYVGLHN